MKLRGPLYFDTGPRWQAGAGSPEGVVTAPVGSMYSRTDGAADTAVYRKETGTGNTGWVPIADVYVATGAPPGTPNVGDLWYDTDQAVPLSGEELAYNQITATVNITSNVATAQNLVIEGTTRSYDGAPVMIEVSAPLVQCPAVAGTATLLNLWDGSTDLGVIGEVYNGSGNISLGVTVNGRRRLTPAAGSHNYRVQGWCNGGSGVVYTAPGGAGSTYLPAFIRVTRV